VLERRVGLIGVLFFLPVPIVLVLFTQMPWGARLSVAIGVAIMVTHRLYARPFALRHAAERCLWCTGRATGGSTVRLSEPLGDTEWRACGDGHRDRLLRTFDWAERHKLLLRAGIGGGLLLFLVGALAGVSARDCVAFFRFAVAAAVLPLGWLATRRPATGSEPIAVPFPVHIQALIGTSAVLWLFRIVGLIWLVLVALHVYQRLRIG
jgi:hypothetical protein